MSKKRLRTLKIFLAVTSKGGSRGGDFDEKSAPFSLSFIDFLSFIFSFSVSVTNFTFLKLLPQSYPSFLKILDPPFSLQKLTNKKRQVKWSIIFRCIWMFFAVVVKLEYAQFCPSFSSETMSRIPPPLQGLTAREDWSVPFTDWPIGRSLPIICRKRPSDCSLPMVCALRLRSTLGYFELQTVLLAHGELSSARVD